MPAGKKKTSDPEVWENLGPDKGGRQKAIAEEKVKELKARLSAGGHQSVTAPTA